MTSKQWRARAEVYEECAGHLDLCWTDNKAELQQGNIVAARLRKLCDDAHAKAERMERRARRKAART
jgi:hypothetical protein